MSVNHPPRRLGLGKRLAFSLVFAALVYAVAEAVVSAVWTRVVPSVYWVFEENGPAVHFDPVSGYRVRGGPARVAKFVRSKNPFTANLEYVGGFIGNAQGYPDRDDFRVGRPAVAEAGAGDAADAASAQPVTRLAVLGDSFSGGDLVVHWPDACEDAVRARGGNADLMNFSLTGIGLANWHSILTREIEPRRYQLDGVVFAVWGNDLARRFYMCDHEGSTQHLGGRVDTWDPDDYPKTREQALAAMGSWEGFIVSRPRFEAALRGKWRPVRSFTPFIASKLTEKLSGAPEGCGPVGAAAAGTLARDLEDTTVGRGRLVREIRESLARMGVPVTVVRIPTIEELMERRPGPEVADVRAFAEYLGARYVDGAAAYDGLAGAALRANWYPVDLHWNQTGSDRFARFMADEVLSWPVQGGEVKAQGSDRRTGAR